MQLRSWRRASHSFVLPPMRESLHAPAKLDLALRVKVCPPPIGCADWPAGRALLEVALRDIPRSGAKVLELGAGVGVTEGVTGAAGVASCVSAPAFSVAGAGAPDPVGRSRPPLPPEPLLDPARAPLGSLWKRSARQTLQKALGGRPFVGRDSGTG